MGKEGEGEEEEVEKGRWLKGCKGRLMVGVVRRVLGTRRGAVIRRGAR